MTAREAGLVGKYHLELGTGTVQYVFKGYIDDSGDYNRNRYGKTDGKEIFSGYCGYNEDKYGNYYNAYGTSEFGYSSERNIHSGGKISKQIEYSPFETAYTFGKGNIEPEPEGDK